MNNVPTTILAMGINDPAPTISGNGAAITPRPSGCAELVSDDPPIFHGITSNVITDEFPTPRNLSACVSGFPSPGV